MSDGHPEMRVQQLVRLTSAGQIAAVRIGAVEVRRLSAQAAFTHLVVEPLRALEQSGACGTILILVDGLDEALAYDPHDNIATLLASVMAGPAEPATQVRFLVTGRPGARLVGLLGEPSLDLIDDEPTGQQDVQTYVVRRLATPLTPPAASPEQDTRHEFAARHQFAARLAAAGAGNFLYARYVLDDLLAHTQPTSDPAAAALPQGLDALYRQFFARELARNEERWTQRYCPLLGLLAVARSPGLTRDHLAAASGVSLSRTDDALASLSPYLTGSAPDGPFMLYHPSFREFLLQEPQYGLYLGEAEQALAELFVQAYGEDWSTCEDDYAIRNTPLHLARAAQALTHPLQRAASLRLQDALSQLLLDYGWLQAKLQRAGIHALLADLALCAPDQDDPTHKLAHALEQSTYVLADDPAQLAPQLLGRLLGDEDHRIRTLLDRARAQGKRPCLLPCMATLRRDGALQRTLARHTDRVTALVVTPDGRRAISASADSTLIVWTLSGAPGANLARGAEPRTPEGHTKAVYAVAVTPDSRRAISASIDRTLRVWDLEKGRVRRVLEGHAEAVTGVAVTPDGKCAVSASADATLKVWDLANGRKLQTLKGHADWVTAVAVTPDGSRAVSASWDNTLRVWDLTPSRKTGLPSGEKLHTLKGHGAQVRAVALTPDGKRALSASLDRTLVVWDLDSGKELGALAGLANGVTDLALTPDGRYAVCASGDTIKVWDISTMAEGRLANAHELATFRGHTALVSCVVVTPDGERCVSVSWDGALKVWDLAAALAAVPAEGREGLASGACLATFHTDERLTVCAISPDGRLLIAGGESGRVHFLRWEA